MCLLYIILNARDFILYKLLLHLCYYIFIFLFFSFYLHYFAMHLHSVCLSFALSLYSICNGFLQQKNRPKERFFVCIYCLLGFLNSLFHNVFYRHIVGRFKRFGRLCRVTDFRRHKRSRRRILFDIMN